MTDALNTKLKIENWDEEATTEFPDGSKIAQAVISLRGEAELGTATAQSTLFYRADGTSEFVGLMRIEATLDGRSGVFVVRGTGRYDSGVAWQEFDIVDASGELAGLRGTLSSRSTHDDYPFMPITLSYDLG
ncbi:MAG: DUF3224 domain-containing protein [Actinobacteria bacterium]|nr:DUF3224 domain-containing protein [Actinomycetota bacterium]